MPIPFRIHNFDNPTTTGNVEGSNTISTEYNAFQSFLMITNLNSNSIDFLPRLNREPPNNSSPPELLFSYTTTVSEPLLSIAEILANLNSNMETSQQLSRNEEIDLDINSYHFSDTIHINQTCSVCTEEFNPDEFISILPCQHMFHTKCIKEWGFYQQSCPLCRIKIPTLTR